MPRLVVGDLLLPVLSLLAGAAIAQSPATGAVRGKVVDSAGGPLAGAEITVTNEATGSTRSARSDARGSYVVPELPLTGLYRVRIAAEGLAPQEKGGIELRAGGPRCGLESRPRPSRPRSPSSVPPKG